MPPEGWPQAPPRSAYHLFGFPGEENYSGLKFDVKRRAEPQNPTATATQPPTPLSDGRCRLGLCCAASLIIPSPTRVCVPSLVLAGRRMVDAAHARSTKEERTLVLLDAAAFASTVRLSTPFPICVISFSQPPLMNVRSDVCFVTYPQASLDLSVAKPDFVCVSFYKARRDNLSHLIACPLRRWLLLPRAPLTRITPVHRPRTPCRRSSATRRAWVRSSCGRSSSTSCRRCPPRATPSHHAPLCVSPRLLASRRRQAPARNSRPLPAPPPTHPPTRSATGAAAQRPWRPRTTTGRHSSAVRRTASRTAQATSSGLPPCSSGSTSLRSALKSFKNKHLETHRGVHWVFV